MGYIADYIKEALDLDEGRREDEKAVASYLEVLLTHMLKCKYQNSYPNKGSWRASIKNSVKGMFKAFGSSYKGVVYKRYYLRELDLEGVYADARDNAIEETGYPECMFPKRCPWTKAQLIDREFIECFIKEYASEV